MLLRHTLLYLPAQILAPLAQFVAAVVWTHWMSPGTYGVFTFIVAAQDLVFVICLSWWSAFCLRYFAGFDPDESDDYRRTEATVLVLTIAVGAVASLALLTYLHVLGDVALVVVAIVFLASRSIDVHFAERARAQERIFDYTIAQTAGPVFGFGLALAGVHFLDASPAVALAGFAVAQAAAALWLRWRLNVDLSLRYPDPTMIRRALAYGMPMVAAGALGWVAMNAVRFVVQELGGEAAMGLFAVGWSLGQRMAGVTAMLVTAASFPLTVRRLATQSRDEAMRQFGLGGTLLFGTIAPAAIGLWQIGPVLVNLTIAEPFRATTLAVLPAAILAGAIRNLRVHYADQSFLLFERTGIGVFINIFEAFAVVVFSTVGYRWAGLAGAAEGCLVATVLGVVIAFVWARLQFNLPVLVADWARIVLATALMGLAVEAVRSVSGSDATRLVLMIIAGGLVYAGALLLLFFRHARTLWRRLDAVPREDAITARR